MAKYHFSKESRKFKKEFSENIDKVIMEAGSEIDKETLELMKYLLKNSRIIVRE
jgi:hypothetical protein